MHWNRQQWAGTFSEDHKLILLEERGPVALFKSQRWTWVKNNLYGESPTYTVWNGDEIIFCGENYREACDKYMNIPRKE